MENNLNIDENGTFAIKNSAISEQRFFNYIIALIIFSILLLYRIANFLEFLHFFMTIITLHSLSLIPLRINLFIAENISKTEAISI